MTERPLVVKYLMIVNIELCKENVSLGRDVQRPHLNGLWGLGDAL